MDFLDFLLKLTPILISFAAILMARRKAPMEREATEAATDKLKVETLASVDHTMVDMLKQLRDQTELIRTLSKQLEECHALLAASATIPQEFPCLPPSA